MVCTAYDVLVALWGNTRATTRQWVEYGGSKWARISLVSALLASPDLTARISSSFTRGDQIASSPLFAALFLISTPAHYPPLLLIPYQVHRDS